LEIQLPNVGAEVILGAGEWRSQKVILENDAELDMAYVRLDWAIENRVPSSSIFPEGINENHYRRCDDGRKYIPVTNGTLATFPALISF
jgi:hypothetical protein